MYQKELRGETGAKSYPVNASDKIIGKVSISKPQKGNNLQLSIHKDIQLVTEKKRLRTRSSFFTLRRPEGFRAVTATRLMRERAMP